jgi:hypothetical protein
LSVNKSKELIKWLSEESARDTLDGYISIETDPNISILGSKRAY